MSKDIKFGTGGWRAVIGDDFTKENVMRFAQGFSNFILENKLNDKFVVIGYDRRFLSDDASRWLAQVISANGIHVQLMKRSSPTPLVMFTVKENKLNFGLEVTASHNPPNFNGIKLIVKEGRDALTETTEKLSLIINSVKDVKSIDLETAEQKGLVSYIKNPFNNYIDSIMNKIDISAIRTRGLRIAFDPMHGSGTYPLLVILFTSRCTVDIINQNKDAYFGKTMPAPTENTIKDLKDLVISDGYDLGIAFDGDGDRIGVIDPSGEYIDANSITVMLYWYLHEFKHWNGPVVRNNSTTHLLDKIARDFNEQCYEVPVGFKYISAKMDETNAILGGEGSGGMTVRGHIFGKDSIYAASLFVEMLSVTGMTPCEIINKIHSKYGNPVFRDKSIKFTIKQRLNIENVIMKEHQLPDFSEYIIDHISYEDGCKIYFKDESFVICRFSGTEPLLRIAAEANNEEICKAYIQKFDSLIEEMNH